MKLNDIFKVVDGGSIKLALYLVEIQIIPNFCIVAHHLSIKAFDVNSGLTNGCVVYYWVIEGKHLKYVFSLSANEMYTVTEREFIVPLQIEKSAMVKKGAFLPIVFDFMTK